MGIVLRDDNSELLNVLAEDGRLFTDDSGDILTVPRGIAHTYGILHQTTNVLVISPASTGVEIKVFLQQRSDEKRIFPGAWTVSCGGHMGTSVDPRKSAAREAEEEIGFSFSPRDLVPASAGERGFPNLLKVWWYDGENAVQMGNRQDCLGFRHGSVSQEVQAYIEALGLLDFPGKDRPDGLELEVFNRERCFYFLLFPNTKEVESSKRRATDGEVKALKEVRLTDFVGTPRPSRTDSTDTLIENCPELQQIIRDNLK